MHQNWLEPWPENWWSNSTHSSVPNGWMPKDLPKARGNFWLAFQCLCWQFAALRRVNLCWSTSDWESKKEDTASKVLRAIDWAEFLDTLDARKRRIVEEMMLGFGTGEIARLFSVSSARIVQLKREIAQAMFG